MEELKTKENKLVALEQLYKQVWETPISRLGKEYGLTDNGLRKICDKLDVPYPPRGYWAKKAAGQKIITYKLPPPKEGKPTGAYIRPTQPQELMPPEVKEAVAAVRAKNPEIPVPEKLVKPHPVIAKWLREYDERQERYPKERDAPPPLMVLSSLQVRFGVARRKVFSTSFTTSNSSIVPARHSQTAALTGSTASRC
jgi:hypothetical protein